MDTSWKFVGRNETGGGRELRCWSWGRLGEVGLFHVVCVVTYTGGRLSIGQMWEMVELPCIWYQRGGSSRSPT